ncbi:MAG TPA: MotA/TolQ/ExbB proton channel family protein [Sedimentisphaerales bacterium]|nr:MotA/TolQ/ExbB proton channel family protein [Sedimentisphaerales bacterium]
MNLLTSVLYWLSTGMMIPMIVLLLIAFGWSLLLLGDLYGQYSWRLRHRSLVQEISRKTRRTDLDGLSLESLAKSKSDFARHLHRLIERNWQATHGEKILTDFELACQRDLDVPLTLLRVGPMLGLMGTLIPMGPALAGLASGDIASMAANMQIAFSTTVVGLFVGGVGFIVQLIRNRWHRSDQALLVYLFELAQDEKVEV